MNIIELKNEIQATHDKLDKLNEQINKREMELERKLKKLFSIDVDVTLEDDGFCIDFADVVIIAHYPELKHYDQTSEAIYNKAVALYEAEFII